MIPSETQELHSDDESQSPKSHRTVVVFYGHSNEDTRQGCQTSLRFDPLHRSKGRDKLMLSLVDCLKCKRRQKGFQSEILSMKSAARVCMLIHFVSVVIKEKFVVEILIT